jgi:phosphate starvation-inducible protein PhoH
MKILDSIEQITFCELDSQDIVRHQLVKKIVSAYNQAK